MSGLSDLRKKLQENLNKTCVVIVANGKALLTLKECCKSLKEHLKINAVEYFCILDIPMYDTLLSMGTEDGDKFVVEGIPLTRVVTQCPTVFATRSTYWNMLNFIPKFKEYKTGIMISSKVGLNKDITLDMISDGNSFTVRNINSISCTKDYTNGKYIKPCNSDSTAYMYSEDDLPTYNNVIYGGDLVKCCMTIEDMIEKDMSQDILLFNPIYYFNKYMWDNKPTKEFVEDVDFANDIQLCINYWKEDIDKLYNNMMEYEKKHPEKEIKDVSLNNPNIETLPEVSFRRIPYPDSVAIKVFNTDNEYHVALLSKCQKQFINFKDEE